MEPIDLVIIVPIYNAGKYLRECLESVERQTYRDWQCMLVNDGSTDDSQTIIDEFCRKDNRFLTVKKENGGSASLARRYALERCSAEWIMSVDADDAIAPNYIEMLVRRQKETGADNVSGRMVYCDEFLNEIVINGERDVCPLPNFDMTQVLSGREACLLTIGGWQIGGRGITKRSLLMAVPPGPYLNSDEYAQRMILLSMNIKAFADVDYYYRGSSGVSQKLSARMFERTLVDMQLEDLEKLNSPKGKIRLRK